MLPILLGGFLVYEIVQHEIVEAKKRAVARAVAQGFVEGRRVLDEQRKALGL